MTKTDLGDENDLGMEEDLGVSDISDIPDNTLSKNPMTPPQDATMFDEPTTEPGAFDEFSGGVGGGMDSTYESDGGNVTEGIVKWVFDPSDIFDSFEMYLRGIVFDKNQNVGKQLYRGFYYNSKKEKILIPYRLMNERGINDAMSIMRAYVSRVTSFSQYSIEEINVALRMLLFDTLARYIVYKNREFEINPEDGYHIPFKMYDLVRSGWLQGYKGKSLGMLGKSTRITETIGGNRGMQEKKPKWQFWK